MSVRECKISQIGHVVDSRGTLNFLEAGSSEVPFDIKRVYCLMGVNPLSIRGEHGHKNLQQIMVALSGSVVIDLFDGQDKKKYILNSPSEGLYVCGGMWRTLSNFSNDAVVLVLASEKYDEDDYIRNIDDFMAFKNINSQN